MSKRPASELLTDAVEKKVCVSKAHCGVVIADIFDSAEIYLFERLTGAKSKDKNAKAQTYLHFFFSSTNPKKAFLNLWTTLGNGVVCSCSLVVGSNQISGCSPDTTFLLQMPGTKHFGCCRNEIVSLTFEDNKMIVTCRKQGVNVVKFVAVSEVDTGKIEQPACFASNHSFAVRFQMPFSHIDTVWSSLHKNCDSAETNVQISLICQDLTNNSIRFSGVSDNKKVLDVNFERDCSVQSSLQPGSQAQFLMEIDRFEKLAELCKIKKSSKGRFLPFSAFVNPDFTALKVVCIDPGIDQDSIPLCLLVPISKVTPEN